MRCKNNQPPTHTKFLCNTRYTIVQKVSNKQSTKVICRFDRLRTAHDKRHRSHMSIENLLVSHKFDYIVLRVKLGLTSFEDLATALHIAMYTIFLWIESGYAIFFSFECSNYFKLIITRNRLSIAQASSSIQALIHVMPHLPEQLKHSVFLLMCNCFINC